MNKTILKMVNNDNITSHNPVKHVTDKATKKQLWHVKRHYKLSKAVLDTLTKGDANVLIKAKLA